MGPSHVPVIWWVLESISPNAKWLEGDTTHLHLVQSLKIRGTIAPTPLCAAWYGA